MSEGLIIDKKILRKELILKRDSIEKRLLKSEKIQNELFLQACYKNAKNIMVYSSIKSEVSTDLIIDKLFSDEKTLIFPKCMENFELYPIETEARSALEKMTYGIMEPTGNTPFPKEKIDLVIVPAVAYDAAKNRLGYGEIGRAHV